MGFGVIPFYFLQKFMNPQNGKLSEFYLTDLVKSQTCLSFDASINRTCVSYLTQIQDWPVSLVCFKCKLPAYLLMCRVYVSCLKYVPDQCLWFHLDSNSNWTCHTFDSNSIRTCLSISIQGEIEPVLSIWLKFKLDLCVKFDSNENRTYIFPFDSNEKWITVS